MGPSNPSRGNGTERRRVRFVLFPQGASTTPYTEAAGTMRGSDGWVTNAQRTGVAGAYTATFNTVATRAFVNIQLSSGLAANAFARVATVQNEGTNNPIVVTWDAIVGGALADLAADVNSRFFFDIEFEYGP